MSRAKWMRWLVIVAAAVTLGGCGPMTFVVGADGGDQRLRAKVVEDDRQPFGPRVAIVDVSGLLVNAHRRGLLRKGENPVSLLHEQLEMARRDGACKAVILRLNTPGGTVTASDAMYREMRRFRRQSGKPVVALMMDVTASGGYYLACAADEMVAYPTTITGSIGVIMQTFSLKGAMNRIGITSDAIVSGQNKAAGSPFEQMTPPQRAILQGLVDDFYARFLKVAREARTNIAADDWNELADGRIFSGSQAAEVGLVDEVGDLYEAFARARALAGIKSADLVVYHRPLDYAGSPYAAAPGHGSGTQVNLAQINLGGLAGLPGLSDGAGSPPIGFYYLWQGAAP